jgi:germination protein M
MKLQGLLAILLLAGAAASCGGDRAVAVSTVDEQPGASTAPAGSTPPTSAPAGSTSTPAPPAAATMPVHVWFTRGETLWYSTVRVPQTRGVGAAAVRALIAGPSSVERSAGVGSAVPAGSQLLGLDISDGLATVDLSSEFAAGGGSLSEQMRLAQLVYTLTEFPTVKGVRLRLDGKDVDVFSGEGIVLPDPMRRRGFADLLPVIVVESPAIGAEVSPGFTVSGSANVFEANVSVELRDAAGRPLTSTFTTASCGTGCRGRYSTTVSYSVPRRQRGVLIVHDDDAAGTGTPPHEVAIPVVLRPA